jgi:cysteine synthase A
LLDPALYDAVMTVDETDARRMARRLASEEGILAGTSSGFNVAGALQPAAQLGPQQTVATVCCDSGLKYLSSSLFDETRST